MSCSILFNNSVNMWEFNLDLEVFKAIMYLKDNKEKMSIRSIARLLNKLNSLRSIQLSIERLLKNGKISVDWDGNFVILDKIDDNGFFEAKTKPIPLVGRISCWTPILAEENIENIIQISDDIAKWNYEYFLLRTKWDSMNKDGIDDWDVVLVKKQSTCNNWDIVVALVDDSATLKEFRKENWIVKLIPHSTNSDNKTIIVTENLIIQWIFVVNLGKI